MNLKKILCPLDFSEPASEIMMIAGGLAENYSAELLVAHVVELCPPLLGGGQDPVFQFQESCRYQEVSARKRLEQMIEEGLPAKIKTRVLVKNGSPALQIIEWAEEYGVDLIVISTFGQSGWRQAFLGSVTTRIIKLTRCPVWLIQPKKSIPSPLQESPVKINRILCPTDFSESADEALKAAVDLAGDYSAELVIVYTVESRLPPLKSVLDSVPNPDFSTEKYGQDVEAAAEKRLDHLSEKMISPEIQIRSVIKKGQPAVQIVEVAENSDADLIVIATHGLTGWRKTLLGSVTERVMKLTAKPMLIIQTTPPGGPIR